MPSFLEPRSQNSRLLKKIKSLALPTLSSFIVNTIIHSSKLATPSSTTIRSVSLLIKVVIGFANSILAVILGTQWKDEKESTKARYISLAQKLKVKHFIEHPDYQYQPRKPSEKKRRMTRRKAAALAESEQAKSSSSVNTTSASGESPSSAKQSTAMVPDLPKTRGGNVVLELGDETMDDEAFAAMLEKYNQSIPPANTPNAVAARNNGNPAVFYDEPTEAAQNDANFYSSVFDYNPFAGNEELAEEMEGIMSSPEGFQAMRNALSPHAQQIAFDEQNESFFDAELGRDEKLGEWCSVFD